MMMMISQNCLRFENTRLEITLLLIECNKKYIIILCKKCYKNDHKPQNSQVSIDIIITGFSV